MWRIESDPVLRSSILVVGLLDRSPTTAGLAEMIENAQLLLPRLRQRITPPRWGPGRPQWSDVEHPSLAHHHIRRVRAPGGDLDAALAVAEPDAAAAFDPARPPWTLTIVDGLDAGRSAVVLRFHHAVTDGVGGIALADRLFDHARRPDRAEAATPTPRTPPGGPLPGGSTRGRRPVLRSPPSAQPGAGWPPRSARSPASPPP
jgi:hypothetical protein